MSQLSDAKTLIDDLRIRLASIVDEGFRLNASNSTEAHNLSMVINSLRQRMTSDKCFNNLARFSFEPGMEALTSELAIKARTKALSYLREMQAIEREIKKVRANRIMGRTSNLGQFNFGFSWSDLDPFSTTDPGAQDRESGLRMVRAYFDAARNYGDFLYTDFDSFITDLNRKQGGRDFAQDVGELVRMNYASTSESQSIGYLQFLANQSKGQATPSQMIQAAGGSGDNVNWTAGIPEIAVGTGQAAITQAAETLTTVGQGVISTLNMAKYLPWIVLGAGVIAIYFYVNKYGPSKKELLAMRAR